MPHAEEKRVGVTATAWLAGLSPWPAEGFGLDRMHALLERLDHPERSFGAIHVVGTNGKSTTAALAADLLRREGVRAGLYVSPHVSSWSERIQIDGAPADFERAVARVRPVAADATQFELLTAAALAEFRECEVEVAVIEAGLGGRLDATNVLAARVVVVTNVALDHIDVLGETREEIAREKLAVIAEGGTVVVGEAEWEPLARARGAARVVVARPDGDVLGEQRALARAAVAAYLDRDVAAPSRASPLPGRFEQRAEGELRAGAHNPAGAHWLVEQPHVRAAAPYVVVASILADKDVDGILRELRRAGSLLVATQSTSGRALSAAELGRRAEPVFESVAVEADPHAALRRARELGGPVLVTGSLYLLADLSADG